MMASPRQGGRQAYCRSQDILVLGRFWIDLYFATEPSGVMAEQPADDDLVDRFVDFVRQFVGFHCFLGASRRNCHLLRHFNYKGWGHEMKTRTSPDGNQKCEGRMASWSWATTAMLVAGDVHKARQVLAELKTIT
jgi:hypothetical protein